MLVHLAVGDRIAREADGGRRAKVVLGIPSETREKGKGWRTGDGGRRADKTYP